MLLDLKTLVLSNLIFQLLLVITLFVGIYLVKRKRALGKHCIIMRVAVPLQIVAIGTVMLPSMLGYISNTPPSALFFVETLIHHTLGLVVVVIWIYINLLFLGIIKRRGRQVIVMRVAFSSWMLSLVIGLHMYSLIWGWTLF